MDELQQRSNALRQRIELDYRSHTNPDSIRAWHRDSLRYVELMMEAAESGDKDRTVQYFKELARTFHRATIDGKEIYESMLKDMEHLVVTPS